jgi:hypothetical protein
VWLGVGGCANQGAPNVVGRGGGGLGVRLGPGSESGLGWAGFHMQAIEGAAAIRFII